VEYAIGKNIMLKMEQDNSEIRLVIEKINDLREFQIQNKEDLKSKIDDLKDFYDAKTDQLKEFYTESRLNMRGDIEEIKQSNKDVSEKLDLYVTNHQLHHNKILKWQTKIIIIIAVIGFLASIGNPYVLPIVMRLIFGIII